MKDGKKRKANALMAMELGRWGGGGGRGGRGGRGGMGGRGGVRIRTDNYHHNPYISLIHRKSDPAPPIPSCAMLQTKDKIPIFQRKE